MNTFSSTLDLPNLSGFDTGIPVTSIAPKYSLLKWALIIFFVIGLVYYLFSTISDNTSEEEISEKMKSV